MAQGKHIICSHGDNVTVRTFWNPFSKCQSGMTTTNLDIHFPFISPVLISKSWIIKARLEIIIIVWSSQGKTFTEIIGMYAYSSHILFICIRQLQYFIQITFWMSENTSENINSSNQPVSFLPTPSDYQLETNSK